jgi:hypothetical protein
VAERRAGIAINTLSIGAAVRERPQHGRDVAAIRRPFSDDTRYAAHQ